MRAIQRTTLKYSVWEQHTITLAEKFDKQDLMTAPCIRQTRHISQLSEEHPMHMHGQARGALSTAGQL